MAKERRRRINSFGGLLRDFADQGLELAREDFPDSFRSATQNWSATGKAKTGSRADKETDGHGGSDSQSRNSRASVDSRRDEAVDELREAVLKLSKKIDDLAEDKANQRKDG
jgi:hypothetical protein